MAFSIGWPKQQKGAESVGERKENKFQVPAGDYDDGRGMFDVWKSLTKLVPTEGFYLIQSIMNNLVCVPGINRIVDFELKIKPAVESKPSPRWHFISVTYLFIVLSIHLCTTYSILDTSDWILAKLWRTIAPHHSGVAFPKLYKLPRGRCHNYS